MNKNILNYIKMLSNNKQIQGILALTIGNILLKQDDINIFIKENENKIIHIKDWISSVIENNEQWKIPRVLTIDALNNAADKYFEKQNNKLKTIELNEKDEKLIADLGDYYIVQMLTPESLDNESKVMQHCIGQGGYDLNLKSDEYQYLSLRDKHNKAHVTLEIYNNKIQQLQGKQNKIPDKKYLENLLPWIINNNYRNIPWNKIEQYYDIDEKKWFDFDDIRIKKNIDFSIEENTEKYSIIIVKSEKAKVYFNQNEIDENKLIICSDEYKSIFLIKNEKNKTQQIYEHLFEKGYSEIPLEDFCLIINQNDNKIYSIYDLPYNCITNNYINYSFDITKDIEYLPDNLTAKNGLNLSACKIKKLPKNLTVKRELILCYTDIEKIPNNLKLLGDLFLNATNIKLPDNFKIIGDLEFRYSKITKLPKNLHVGGTLDLSSSNIIEINNDLDVQGEIILCDCKNLQKLPNNFTTKNNLNLNNCINLNTLPKNMNINGDLYLNYTKIKELPEDIKIKNGLFLFSSEIEKLPNNLIINGTLDISFCKQITELPNGLVVKNILELTNSRIQFLPNDMKCNIIYITENQTHLITEDIDFNEVSIGYNKIYTKEEFFEAKKNLETYKK